MFTPHIRISMSERSHRTSAGTASAVSIEYSVSWNFFGIHRDCVEHSLDIVLVIDAQKKQLG